MILAPSILAADFSCLDYEVGKVGEAGAQWLHLDIMDYHFVPNLTFGAPIIKKLRPITDLVFDAHLMVGDPHKFIDSFAGAGVDWFTFHYEAVEPGEIPGLISDIRDAGMKPGISIKPGTPAESIAPFLELPDLVLVMSVEPGFGGQKFMPDSLDKVRYLKQFRENHSLKYKIQIDGGINRRTAPLAAEAGVDVLVAGTAVFGADDIAAEVEYFLNL